MTAQTNPDSDAPELSEQSDSSAPAADLVREMAAPDADVPMMAFFAPESDTDKVSANENVAKVELFAMTK